MSFAIDRPPSEPSLLQMTQKALELLSQADLEKKGFVLFVEGSLIDIAGHGNDAGSQVREVLEYDATISMVADWVDAHPSSIMVSLSDHATGGLALGMNLPGPSYPSPYAYYVTQLLNQNVSLLNLASTLRTNPTIDMVPFVLLHTGFNLTASQAQILVQWRFVDEERFGRELGEMISAQGYVSWSSWGHDGVDVPLYAYGTGASNFFRGSMRNDLVGQTLSSAIGLTAAQAAVTKSLKGRDTIGHPDGWRGNPVKRS